VMSRSRAS